MENTTQFDSVKKIWSGANVDVSINRNANFGGFILGKLADSDPDRILQIDGDSGEMQTANEIRTRTIRCAQNLLKFGCSQNSRIALIARNHQHLTPLIFAAFCVGSPITPMDVVIVKDGASQILQRLQPTFIFCDDDVILRVKQITDDIKLSAKLFTVSGMDEITNKNSFDEDGFFITGDIGYFDESGRLYISGRKKDIFKNRGCSIWPSEIEDIIQKSPAVRHVCVLSVFDDEIMSDLPAAVVVKNEQHPITKEEIYSLVADRLADYKRLDGGIFFVDQLPMTPSGKVIQTRVKQMAQTRYEFEKQKLKLSKL